MRIKKKGGDWLWIHFKYERLPSFCFFCGIIGHSDKFCELLFDNPEKGEERKFDINLRAPTRRQQTSSSSQWMRGEDGNMLNMATPDNSERMSEHGEKSGMQLDRWRDLRKPQQENNQQINKDDSGEWIEGDDNAILKEGIDMGTSDGIIISK